MAALVKTWWFWAILVAVFLIVFFVTKHYNEKEAA